MIYKVDNFERSNETLVPFFSQYYETTYINVIIFQIYKKQLCKKTMSLNIEI